MKRITTMLIMAIMAAFVLPVSADAQLNGLLKKAKKTVEQAVSLSHGDAQAAQSQADTQAANPLADVADIQILYASGDTVSANYGRLTLVVSVNMKVNKPQIRLGSVNNAPMMAVTADGKVYKPELNLNGVYPKDVVEGCAVTIPLDDKDMIINDIPLGTSMLQTVKLGVLIDPQHKETLTFHNVPIKWEHNSTPNE